MKESLVLIFKGIIVGAGKIIPGVSGGMLAITLNIYDKLIAAISDFFKDIKKNFTFLFTVGIGILISILIISKVIKFSLDNYYLPTMLLFIGMIIGGIPSIVSKCKKEMRFKNLIIMLIPFIIMFLVSTLSQDIEDKNINVNFFSLVLIGIVDAITMIIPGISGTAVLMMLGYYDLIISAFSTFTNMSLLASNLEVIIPFGCGLILGIIILSKIINFVLNKYTNSCYYAIIGFTISSILLLLKETLKTNYSLGEIIVSLILLIVGYFISKKADKMA